MLQEEIDGLFHSQVSLNLQVGFVQLIRSGYRSSFDRAGDHGNARLQREAWGYDRRITLEASALHLPERFPEVSVELLSNKNGSANHAVMRVGDFSLVECLSRSSKSLPRFSMFRGTKARFSQVSLFPELMETVDFASQIAETIFGIIIHHPSQQRPLEPSFVRVVFPNPAYKTILHYIDLLAAERSTKPVIVVADQGVEPVRLSLRRKLEFGEKV